MNEIVKAIATALVTQIVSATGVFEVVSDPYSKAIKEAQDTIKLVNSWAEARAHLESIAPNPLRDEAEEKINQAFQKIAENQARYAEMRAIRRERLFRILTYLRIAGIQGWARRAAAFLFYVFAILAAQSMRISRWEKNAWFTPILVLSAAVFWVLSWPKKKVDSQLANSV